MLSKSGETWMAMGTRRRRQRQERLWISHNELAKGPGHPFYQRVNELLEKEQFDAFAEMANPCMLSNSLVGNFAESRSESVDAATDQEAPARVGLSASTFFAPDSL
jgi:hypothetical protein